MGKCLAPSASANGPLRKLCRDSSLRDVRAECVQRSGAFGGGVFFMVAFRDARIRWV